MDKKTVKDLMVPLDEYPLVRDNATLLDAALALDEALKNLPPGRQPYRAVLVTDKDGRVIGKIGQWIFLKALEPKYGVLGDLGKLARAGVSAEVIASMMEHYRLFQDNLSDSCRRASAMKVTDVMHPVAESIDETAPLSEAIHQLVIGQTLSVLVTRQGQITGLLRLSDLFDAITEYMKHPQAG
jgi:CBS domain-containing protein